MTKKKSHFHSVIQQSITIPCVDHAKCFLALEEETWMILHRFLEDGVYKDGEEKLLRHMCSQFGHDLFRKSYS